jgi:dephospho-CoA kinase
MTPSLEDMLAGKQLIGLTGNIATGKSTARKMLVDLGAIAIDADEVAREVVQPGQPALAEITRIFGHEVIQADGALDRRALAAIVFRDPEKLRLLEAVTHPAVRAEITRRIARLPVGSIVVLEAIKLLESGWRAHCDRIWVTTCTPDTQLQRLMQSRGMSEQDARMRIEAQPPQADKIAAADLVIDSESSVEKMRAQIKHEWDRIRREISH